MTPKDKARELFDKFLPLTKKWDEENGWVNDESDAQHCALISVEEILKSIPLSPTYEYNDGKIQYTLNSQDYWETVKTQIEEL